MAPELARDTSQVVVIGGLLEVGLDAADVVHGGAVDHADEARELALEGAAQRDHLRAAARLPRPRLGLDLHWRFEELVDERVGRAMLDELQRVGVDGVLVLLAESVGAVLDLLTNMTIKSN